MRIRTSIFLGAAGVALLLAGCVPPANSPPAWGYGPPPPQQQPGYPPPAEPQPAPPSPDPYQPSPDPYQPAPAPAPQPQPQPPVAEESPPEDWPEYVDIEASEVAGDEVPSVDVFYDQLEPYGSWYDDPSYGWVFVPNTAGYVPYSNGFWKNTE